MQDDNVIKINKRREKKSSNIKDSNENEEKLYCSFCGKSNHDVLKMVKGPGVNICSDCVMIAVQYLILHDKMPATDSQKILDTFWGRDNDPA